MRDSADFDAFYLGSRRRLVHRLYAMTGDLGTAQDVVQEAYARAWQRWDRISGYDDPEAWVRTVAWRLAAGRWRKARNAIAAQLRVGPPAPTLEPSPDMVVLVAALRRLPDAQRRAIVLHHLCDLPVEEVSRETGAPVGTVKARLARGRAALGQLLADSADDALADRPSTPGDSTPREGSHV